MDTKWRQLSLLAGNGYRMGNVIFNRFFHRRPRYLPVLLMFVTNRCNLRCKMCGVCEHEQGTDSAQELTAHEWKKVIDSARKLGTTLVSVTGGEPLLRPDVFEIMRYARDAGMSVHSCTNGVILTADRVQRLRAAGVQAISISVESPDKEIHDRLRGPGSFDAAIRGVRLLREQAPEIRVGLNYCITTYNFHNMSRMIPFAESLDVHQIKFGPIHTNLLHKRKRLEQYGELIFTQEHLDALDHEVKTLMHTASKSRLQTTSTVFFSGITQLYTRPRPFRCYAGYAMCVVNPYGFVSPCCDMDGAQSVRDIPLEVIWRGKEFARLRHHVATCNSLCWDTTNTEMSLRLRLSSMVREFFRTWKDIRFYFDE